MLKNRDPMLHTHTHTHTHTQPLMIVQVHTRLWHQNSRGITQDLGHADLECHGLDSVCVVEQQQHQQHLPHNTTHHTTPHNIIVLKSTEGKENSREQLKLVDTQIATD